MSHTPETSSTTWDLRTRPDLERRPNDGENQLRTLLVRDNESRPGEFWIEFTEINLQPPTWPIQFYIAKGRLPTGQAVECSFVYDGVEKSQKVTITPLD